MRNEIPPQGVRLRLKDGSAIECKMARAPELDREGATGTVTYWKAFPETVPASDVTYVVECDVLPARTGFRVEMETTGFLDGMEPPVKYNTCPRCLASGAGACDDFPRCQS